MSRWRRMVVALAATALWTVLVVHATVNGWGRQPLAPAGDAAAFLDAARSLIDAEPRGNVAVRLIQQGAVAGEHYASAGAPVDADTRFQVASVSKWVAAAGVLALADAGRIELDAPVSRYLTRWSLPAHGFDGNGVTVRRLLSHTAGLTDGLGYRGFVPGMAVQSLESSLTLAADAMPGTDGRTRVGARPGSSWRYSGGGYALLQLLIEETSGEPFESFLQRAVLRPLAMHRSTYDPVRPLVEPGLAEFYLSDGGPAVPHHYAAPAAAGLYTTAADLTRFVTAHFPGAGGMLSADTLAEMRTPQASLLGIDIWGLGVMLYTRDGSGGHVFGHDGHNLPAARATVRIHPGGRHALIALTNGHDDLVTWLGTEWVFWQTGRLDVMAIQSALQRMGVTIGVGCLAIVLATFLSARLFQRGGQRGGSSAL